MISIIPRAIRYELGLFHVLILTEHMNVPMVWLVLLDTQMPPRVWILIRARFKLPTLLIVRTILNG